MSVDTSAAAVERAATVLRMNGHHDKAALIEALAAERDAERAAAAKMREALTKIAGISNECTWTPKTRGLAAELQDIVRAALAQQQEPGR